DHTRALPQGNGGAGPTFTGGVVGGERNLIVLDASDVLHDAFAIRGPHIDAKGEVSSKCRSHLRLPLLHSSWAAGARVKQLATESIAECIRNGGVREAESNIEWLNLVSASAPADWDASFTMERINLKQNTPKAFRRNCEFDQIREVPFVPKADDLALATSHLAQSSSASRVTAGASGFLF